MKLCVIGSEGYLGSEVVDLAVTEGHEVIRIDAGVHGQHLSRDVRQVFTSMGQVNVIDLTRPDAVIDLAAYAHDPLGKVPFRAMVENNWYRPTDVAQECVKRDIPYTVASSMSVFSPEGAYPQSKRHMEADLLALHAPSLISIVRLGTLFGPARVSSYRPHLLLNGMVLTAVADNCIHVSNPRLHRPVFPVRRAAYRLLQTVTLPGPKGDIQNSWTASGSLSEYAELVSKETGASIEMGKAGPDTRDYGWPGRPVSELGLYVEELVAWTRENLAKIQREARRFPGEMYRFVEKRT